MLSALKRCKQVPIHVLKRRSWIFDITHGNAPTHTSVIVMSKIHDLRLKLLTQFTYLPDLAPPPPPAIISDSLISKNDSEDTDFQVMTKWLLLGMDISKTLM